MAGDSFGRLRLLLGEAALDKLRHAHVAVCGLGGVGSYAAEALARSAVGKLTLIDFDRVAASNINRQLCALTSSVGAYKADIIAARIADINPNCRLHTHEAYISAENVAELLGGVDYVLDAIDHVPAKLDLICYAHGRGLPLISAMGAGKRLDPAGLRISDISQTHTCPLARIIRRELSQRGIKKGVRVVFSTEKPIATENIQEDGRVIIGSAAFVPGAVGLLMASWTMREIAQLEDRALRLE